MNNFHINLLRKDETTSPSALNAGSLKRIGLPLIPILITATVAIGYLAIHLKRQELTNTEQRNRVLKHEKEQYEKPASLSDTLQASLKDLKIWQELQPPASDVITLLIAAVPETMQIVSFDIGRESDPGARNAPPGEVARSYRFVMNCKAAPQCKAKDIRELVAKLESSNLIETAREFNYSEGSAAGGTPNVRSFQVECTTSRRSVK